MGTKLNNIELFAGAGGLLDGFEKNGSYNLIAAVEWLKPQVNTLVNRLENKYDIDNAKDIVLNFDIQRTSELFEGWTDPEFGSSVGLDALVSNRTIDVISGGPPCQAYSLAGRIRDANGMRDDYRNFLFEAYIEVVERYRPKIIVFENVEGILSAIPTGEKITNLIRKKFTDIGYEIINDLRANALINLNEYGVPQNRKRVIIVGIRKDVSDFNYQYILKDFYQNILASKKTNKVFTVKDAIKDLPPIYPLESPEKRKAYANNSNINGHYSRFQNIRDQEIFFELARDIEQEKYEFTNSKSLIDLYYKKTGKKTNVHKYNVLRWDRPSNTIPAHLKKDGLRHIHPDPTQRRSITVREAARIQTFDDDFEFNESMGASFEMVGNAVPPLFAKKLADSIISLNDKLKQSIS